MSFPAFLYSQLFKSLPYPTGNYHGKTVVITGSNTGLGKEAARHYVRMGASRMILAVRNLDKGNEAKRDIESTTQCGQNVIEVWKLNMASYVDVQRFAAKINSDLDRLDVFSANAGVAPGSYKTLEDNESSITVNVVSTMLLSALIMPKLKSTASIYNTRPTLSIVSSDVHGHTTFPQGQAPEGQIFQQVNDKEIAEKHWDEMYPISKLLPVFAVRAIVERHPAENFPVNINLVNPGLCHSELGRDIPTFAFWLIKKLLARTTEAGSRTVVHGGASGVESHGSYLSDCTLSEPAGLVTSADGHRTQERVYAEMVKKLEAIKPGVMSNF